jgi:glycosyltransferase involved in cell wall biosynthesis
MGKPLVTADTPAAREALDNGKNAILVPPGDPEALAEAVATLHKDAELREKISAGGLALFHDRFSYSALGKALVEEFERRFAVSGDK